MSGNGPFDDDDDDQEELFFGYPAAAPAPSSSSNPTHNNVDAGIDEFPEVLGGLLDLKYLQQLEEKITPRTSAASAIVHSPVDLKLPLPRIIKLANGYSVHIVLEKIHVNCNFSSLEKAALAYLYARRIHAYSRKTGSDNARRALEKTLRDNPGLKPLYNTLYASLDRYKAKGVDIRKVVNDAIAEEAARRSNSDNPPPSASKRVRQMY